MERLDLLDHQGLKDLRALQALKVQQAHLDLTETEDQEVHKVLRQQVPYTRDGEKAPAHLLPEQAWCTQEELEALEPLTLEEGLITSVCRQTQSSYTLLFHAGIQGDAYVHGAEYESTVVGTDDQNAVCAVCLASTREIVLMIPAKTSCPSGWTEEYEGYLMTAHRTNHRSTFECVDKYFEPVPASQGQSFAAAFFHVEADCTGLQCQPYDAQKELTCVVCTK